MLGKDIGILHDGFYKKQIRQKYQYHYDTDCGKVNFATLLYTLNITTMR